MKPSDHALLINPWITSRRSARFPLSIMNLAAAIDDRYLPLLVDGNMDDNWVQGACEIVRNSRVAAAGITVMGGPQVASAIEVSRALRTVRADLPIIWGGYFPSLYPDVALNNDYVDYVIRGQGEDSFSELLDALTGRTERRIEAISGLSMRRNNSLVHNPERKFLRRHLTPRLRYDQLRNKDAYLVKTFLGERTVGYQAALGCRFRCTFCGVAAMFNGTTALPDAERLDRDLSQLRNELGADSIQFYDHNFFEREEAMLPLLEVLAKHALPWWCYARADALLNLSDNAWKLVRESRLRMAYIGAETPNDALLRSIRKGTRSEQTLDVAALCRRHGVIPELSFMLAPPENTEAETERTFEFIKKVKQINPDAEIITYIHTPLPPDCVPNAERLELPPLLDIHGEPVRFPITPEEWTEKRWVDYACHADAPWISATLRRRIRDFVTVLRCRYPTVQDTRAPGWAKAMLRGMASWRYASGRYDRPWELAAIQGLIGLADPRRTSI